MFYIFEFLYIVIRYVNDEVFNLYGVLVLELKMYIVLWVLSCDLVGDLLKLGFVIVEFGSLLLICIVRLFFVEDVGFFFCFWVWNK